MQSIMEPVVPYSVHRFLSGLSEPMKTYATAHIDAFLRATGAAVVTIREASEAISYAFSEYQKDQEMQPDLEFVQRSAAAYDAGDWQDIDEVIDELQGAIA